MSHRLLGLLTGVVSLSWCSPALAAPGNVTVRAEGKAGTLVAPTTVTTTTTPVNKTGNPGETCPGTSAIGALELATAGDWGGTYSSSFGYSVERIRSETHTFSSGRYFAFYLNDRYQNTGACQTEVQTGDEVLFYVACAGATTECYSGEPLDLKAPATVAPGAQFTVTVKETNTTYDSNYNGTSTLDPSKDATVSGDGATATTDSQGHASLTLAERGPRTLRATKPGRPPDAVTVCVTDGADGFCGTSKPGDPPPPACQTLGDDGNCGTTDRRPPLGQIQGIAEGRRFPAGKGPRELRGVVTADPSGLGDVRLRLTRNDRGRCQTYDAATERFVRLARCGALRGRWFSVGDRETWSYLLPAALGRGRYVLDVQVVDRLGNRDTVLQRTRNRIVFFVG